MCSLATSTCLGDAPADKAGAVVLSEFIYTEAPFPSCHASTLEETPDGLIAAWFGGTHERHPDVGIWVSRKTSQGWSTPVEVATGETDEQRYPTWNPVLFQPTEGPLLLFYKVGPSPQEWWGMLMKSEDHGRTWSAPQRLPDGIFGPIKNKPVELADGVLLCPSSTEDEGWRVHFETTSDFGNTWQRTAPLNDPETIRAIQPSILTYGPQTLQAIGRTRESGIFQIWSQNGGKDWGPMTTLGLPNPSSGTDAVTLAGGEQLLVYNHSPTYKIRSPLNVATSTDGIKWNAALVLEDDPEAPAGYSYPATIQTSDGLVHITYTWRRERIKHVVIDPQRLATRKIVDGQWPAGMEGAR
ncbi:exo-alpha-sialidase [Aeoliella sp. ICT_H6.2]|uniref:Exo-alpha-sialidase n=1 Tax=Aeoliella straminimaris TaxID=2954799 RepID=A0A9X2FGT4_9BACT|nr:exo-alpha-sialidase [Aeoliella straminimaris]